MNKTDLSQLVAALLAATTEEKKSDAKSVTKGKGKGIAPTNLPSWKIGNEFAIPHYIAEKQKYSGVELLGAFLGFAQLRALNAAGVLAETPEHVYSEIKKLNA
jgi:hypothetical protein